MVNKHNACAKCGSERIVPSARILDRLHHSGAAGNLTLVVYESPDALIFKGAHDSDLFARVCGDCGYTELFVENPADLYEVYVNSLNDEE
jgi:ribosomal protein S27AE